MCKGSIFLYVLTNLLFLFILVTVTLYFTMISSIFLTSEDNKHEVVTGHLYVFLETCLLRFFTDFYFLRL